MYFDKTRNGILKRSSGVFGIITLLITAIPAIYISFLLYETMTIKIFGPQLLAIILLFIFAGKINETLDDIIGNKDFDKLESYQKPDYTKSNYLELPPYILANIKLYWRYLSKKKRKQYIEYLYKTEFNYYWNNDRAWYGNVPDFLMDKHAIKYYLKNSETAKGLDINKKAIELVEAWTQINKFHAGTTPYEKREIYRETFPEANTIFVDYFTNKTADFLKIPVYSPIDFLLLIYYRIFKKENDI